jgi:hypothetical protein
MIESKPTPDPSSNLMMYHMNEIIRKIEDKDLGYLLILENGKEMSLSAKSVNSNILAAVIASFFKKEYPFIRRLIIALRILF